MKRNRFEAAFALPTVVITSIIMMIVLLSALTAASSVQASLKQNYYDRVARNAAEAGSTYAAKCLTEGDYTQNIDITPETNCKGAKVGGRSPLVLNTPEIKSTFVIRIAPVGSDQRTKIASITGKLQFYGKSGTLLSRNVESQLKQRFSLEQDKDEIRATQRWWYFGSGAVMDFRKSGTLRDFKPSSGTHASEGSTTVSDPEGNLLFWSNGLTIWDKTGSVMNNGSGLKGATSATQAVAAFPLDSSYRKFGVVSNNAVNEVGPGELSYSIIDMQGNNNKGSVVLKNVPLGGAGYSHEGIGAMPSNRAGEFWVYSYRWSGSNIEIRRFLVGDGTTAANAVKSSPAATTLSPGRPSCSSSAIGYGTFNFSNDYSKMLLYAGQYRCSNQIGGRAYMLETNLVSGAPTLKAHWETSTGGVGAGYSADFSPSEKYVYVSHIYPGKIMRYNVESLNSTTIKNSEWVNDGPLTNLTFNASIPYEATHEAGGQIRRGPDGRMYIADQAYYIAQSRGQLSQCRMSVINNPDAEAPDQIDLRVDGLSMPTDTCSVFGLPQMATVYKPKIILY